MPVIILQQLGVFVLAVLFSLLFVSINNRKQKAEKAVKYKKKSKRYGTAD